MSFLGERDYLSLILRYLTGNTSGRIREALTVHETDFKAYYRYYLPCYYKGPRVTLFSIVAFKKLITIFSVKTIVMLTKA